MDYAALKQEIENGPLAAELAPLIGTEHGDTNIAALLNDATRGDTVIRERLCTAGTLLAKLGPEMGGTVLDKLEAAAQSSSAVKWAMRLILSSGIDAGDPGTRAQLDALAQAGVLTAQEATAIKAIAVFPAARAEVAGFGIVTAGDVSRALRGPW